MAENEEGKDFESYKRLCQFWGVLQQIENDDVYNRFLDQEKVNTELKIIIKQAGDINYQFSSDDLMTLCNPEVAGCTALHLAVGRKNEVVEVVLSRPGIDITVKNRNGSTALHEAAGQFSFYYQGYWRVYGGMEMRNVNMILSAHLQFNVAENPRNKRGVSHFHIACMANNAKAVEFFISKGVSVHQVAVGDFSSFLGYTPLHFAVACCALETVEILLKHGADVSKKEAKGLSPLHLLLQQSMTVDGRKIMAVLLRHVINLENPLEFDGKDLSLLHMACTLPKATILEQLLTEVEDNAEQCEETDTTFAAHFDAKILKFLLQRSESNVNVKDANGLTSFDIALEKCKVEDLQAIISSNSVWRDILLSDNKTRLPDIICAMKDSNTLDEFLDGRGVESCASLRLPNDSPLWPGYTLLHLAVNFSENEQRSDCTKDAIEESEREYYVAKMEVCLERGADVTAQDARGWTALHLAYRLQKANAVRLLLQAQSPNVSPIDEDNLSHFYIACAFDHSRLVEELLSSDSVEVDVNARIESTFERRNCKEPEFFVTAGSTALHAAVTSAKPQLVRILLEHGADVNAKDSNGVTPVHRALASAHVGEIGKMLLSSPNLQQYTFRGLNYLHLAAEFRSDDDIVERLIGLGADVNSTIDFHAEAEGNLLCMAAHCQKDQLAQPFAFMSKVNRFRPVDIAIQRDHRNMVKILLKRGVDIFAKDRDGWSLFYGALHGSYCGNLILSMIEADVGLRQRMQEETGVTMLHLACKECDIDKVADCLKNGANVNAQVKLDSAVWPGYTAMHVLVMQAYYRTNQEKLVCSVMKLLLANGADLMLINSEKSTPLHIASMHDAFYSRTSFTESLLQSMKDFNIYPTDAQGISHFHIACLRCNLDAMKEFLKCNLNVNQPIAVHSNKFPGCTPLHLVLQSESRIDNEVRIKAIDLLLKHGANAHATDLYGNNAFHFVIKCSQPRMQLFEKIFSIGTTMTAKNIFGEEPLGLLLSSRKFEYAEVKFFLNHNCHANIYDPIREEGYLRYLFGNNHPIRKIVKHPSITKIDDLGRNAIHNIVSWEFAFTKSYYQIIPMLMERGCRIDQQDKLGRTPLHLALNFSNYKAVIDLLGAGADINVTDAEDHSPFSRIYSLSKDLELHQYDYQYSRIATALAMHVHKLQLTGLYVSDLNVQTLELWLKKFSFDKVKIERTNDELTKMKNLKIESILTCPYDFFSETGAIAAYPYMTAAEQQAIDKFFTSMKKRDFSELAYLLKIRHGKALKRMSLLMPAKIALNLLLKCALPEKCSRRILQFLSNAEIENVIASANLVF